MSVFDPAEARRSIEATYPLSVAGMLSVSYIDPSTGAFRPGQQFARTDVDGLLGYAAALDASGAPGTYLRNCTVRLGVVGRGTAADSVELPGVFHDVDYGTVGHSAKNNPPDAESAWKIVVKSGLPEPTGWIHSGGGLYPRWLLPHPVSIGSVGFEAADLLIKKYHAALQNAAHDLGWDFGDECKDLATVMRLPGSRNRKNGTDRPCRILSDNGPRYSFDELCEAVTHIEVTSVSTRAGTSAEVEALFARLTDPHGDACDWMKATLGKAVDEVRVAGGSCRDVALKKAAAIARGGAEGHWGARAAMAELRDVFLAHRVPGTTTGKANSTAENEWDGYSSAIEPGAWAKAATHVVTEVCSCSISEAERWAPMGIDVNAPTALPTATLSANGVPNVERGPVAYMLGAEKTSDSMFDNGWPDPQPLEAAPDALPLSSMGPIAGPMAAAVADAIQVPADMVITMALPIITASARGRWEIQVTNDWVEPLILCGTSVLASGERKSATIRELTRPLREFEQTAREAAAPEIARQEAQLLMQKDRLTMLRNVAVKGQSVTGADGKRQHMPASLQDTEAYIAASQAAATSRVDHAPRWIADDATPEAIVRLLDEQKGAIAAISSEAGIFGILAGRYTGGAANLEVVLQATSGDPIHVDRKGSEPVNIERPALSMSLALQPGLLPDLSESSFRYSGLLARFLWAVPEPRVGTRPVVETPIPREVASRWSAAITTLAAAALEMVDAPPRRLALTAGARGRFDAFRAELEPRLHPSTGDLAAIGDWGSKLPGQIAKIAGALTLLTDVRAVEISEDVMVAAIVLGHAYISHAVVAFGRIHTKTAEGNRTREVLAWLVARRSAHFTARQAYSGLRNRVWARKAVAVKAVLDVLAAGDHVRRVETEVSSKGGRPSEVYELHPCYLSQ